MAWKVTFYSEKVENQTLALPAGILANLFHILELVEEFGPSIGRPHSAPLGKGLFEIRAKGPEGISRSLFCLVKGQEIVILHSFIKKTQKVPKKHLDIARNLLKEVMEND
ncbi:MAG: type II toxin-antitoxin system RelE/ParE family toxin [Pseudomonadota bacterium]|nr:type II toxin-antitoxin system RelE/ParE family toxin [Pseudomonadota bacterium]